MLIHDIITREINRVSYL